MDFTRNEKLSILHVINAVMIADGDVSENETNIMNVFLHNFGCRLNDIVEAKNMDVTLLVKTVRDMSQEKKASLREL